MSLKAVLCEVWGFLKKQSEKKIHRKCQIKRRLNPINKNCWVLHSSPLSLQKPQGAILLQWGDVHGVLQGIPGCVIAQWRQPCQSLSLEFLLWYFSDKQDYSHFMLSLHICFFRVGSWFFCATCFPVINVYRRYMLSCATFLFPSIFRFYISVNILPPPAKELFL